MDHTLKVLRKPKGVTLVELTIAMAITGSLVAGLYSFLQVEAMATQDQSVEIQVQTNIRRCEADLIDQLQEARIAAIDTTGLWIRFQVPQKGPARMPVLNSKGDMTFGVYQMNEDKWYSDRYYQITFKDSPDPDFTIDETKYKQDFNNDGDMKDVFVYGELEITRTNLTGTTSYGIERSVNGQVLREINPYGGAFYMRQAQANLGKNGSPQRSESFTDTNGNGVWDGDTYIDWNGNGRYDSGEPYYDRNSTGVFDAEPYIENTVKSDGKSLHNSKFDEPDAEPFGDQDNNNVRNDNEAYTDYNGNGKWDASLRLQIMMFDQRQIVNQSGVFRNKFSQVRIAETKIQLRHNDK